MKCRDVISFKDSMDDSATEKMRIIIFPYYSLTLQDLLNQKWTKSMNLLQFLFAGIVRGL